MDNVRWNWLQRCPNLRNQVIHQTSDICWAIACAFCVGAVYTTRTGVRIILATQDLIDNAILYYPEAASRLPNGNLRIDHRNCVGMYPEYGLKFVQEHGIRLEVDYPFRGDRLDNPPPRGLNSPRIYIQEYRVLADFQNEFMPLTEDVAYDALRYGGPMMGSVLATVEFRDYTGGIIQQEGVVGVDVPHSVVIVGIDKDLGCFMIQNSMLGWGNGEDGVSVGWILYGLVFDILQPVLIYPVIPYRWGNTGPRSAMVNGGIGQSSGRGSRGGRGGSGQRGRRAGGGQGLCWGGWGRRGRRHQCSEMKDIATENFQQICEASEILSDENKRHIYDMYGVEGLTSGLELGPELGQAEEIKQELGKLRRQEHDMKVLPLLPSGEILANLSLPHFLDGDGIMRWMSMSSEFQSQVSKRNFVAVGGNVAVIGESGGAGTTAVLRHPISSASTIEFMASAGLQSLVGLETSRQLSANTGATMGLLMSLKDGSINLTNSWTRQVSESTDGNIELSLGSGPSIAVGWRKEDKRMSADGSIQIGASSVGASAQYICHFSSKSHGRVAAKVGSCALEIQVGGGRKISNFSTVCMSYAIGIQGIFWKFELHRVWQKLIIPILEPLISLINGAPLEDARHLAQRYSRVRQEAETQQATEVARRRARVREAPIAENVTKVHASEARMQELKGNMSVLGKEASAALAVVESQQQRLTFQRLVALIEDELTYHERVAAILLEIETEIVYEKQRKDSAPPVIAANLFSGKTMYFLAEMKDIATEHFQRICEAYELLSDVNKRHIYDMYGMEGLTSGLELGPELGQAEEIKQELGKLRRQEQDMKFLPLLPSGEILSNLSLPQFLVGYGIVRGMSMSSEFHSQVSKKNFIDVGGNVAVIGESGGAGTTAVLRHQISSASTIEFMASAGLQSLVGLETSRQLSANTGATMGLLMSLKDGSINLTNSWTRQLSESTDGNIELSLGSGSSIAIGWRKEDERMSADGAIKVSLSGWSEGECRGRAGWFPSAYVDKRERLPPTNGSSEL